MQELVSVRSRASTGPGGKARSPVRRRLLMALPTLAATILVIPRPVIAGTSMVSGAVAFSGTANINVFPCAGCTGGSITGALTATLAGVDGSGAPWAATWLLASAIMPTVQHTDLCPPFNPPVPPTDGFGKAGLIVGGGHFTVGGTGDPASLSGGVSWNFYESTLIFNIDYLTVSGARGGVALGTGLAPGSGQFTPISLGLVPTCATPGPLAATMAVADVQIE